jgi:hypothetical protein
MRKAWTEAFDLLGGVPSLVVWGRENPDDFYKMASKLITVQAEVTGKDGGAIKLQSENITDRVLRELPEDRLQALLENNK